MKEILYPSPSDWRSLCKRPSMDRPGHHQQVSAILDEVRKDGDQALLRFAKNLDGVQLSALKVSTAEIETATASIDSTLSAAISQAHKNITAFHKAQVPGVMVVETMPGVVCKRIPRPITRVGLYIPGGSAPLFSTVLMLGIPAQLAGCREVVLCTPPAKDGSIHPAILFAASLCGIQEIYKSGGAQAIGAMAFGTEQIAPVHKIFGPGNQYVTMAKQLVAQEGTAIDMPAGPSEVLVIADASADPDFVAADLLSQAEHGPDSQVVLTSNSVDIIQSVKTSLEVQLKKLPRAAVASQALDNSLAVVFSSLDECVEFANAYAPEHLIINTLGPQRLLERVDNAGSVFLGPWTPEAAGDYASGTNHTLPTGGYARSSAGVSVDSFIRQMTVQEITRAGLESLGPVVETMATAETLEAHRQAVRIRLNKPV